AWKISTWAPASGGWRQPERNRTTTAPTSGSMRLVYQRDTSVDKRQTVRLSDALPEHPTHAQLPVLRRRRQRVSAASLASALRSAGVSASIRALPPLGPPTLPPRRPRATACGFFRRAMRAILSCQQRCWKCRVVPESVLAYSR